MRTNTKTSSRSPGSTGHPPTLPLPEAPSEVLAPSPEPRAEGRPAGGSWAEDWSDPSKQPQMSPIWPLLWLAIPFVLLVVYGLVTEH